VIVNERERFDAAVTRLRVALTSGQADRYDPALLMAQLQADLGRPVPVEWWNIREVLAKA
jgi:hypothetical protein